MMWPHAALTAGAAADTYVGGSDMVDNTATPPPLCACGCGEPVRPGKRFIHGHNRRMERPGPNPSGLCMCGCGQPTAIATQTKRTEVRGKPRRFIFGHSSRLQRLNSQQFIIDEDTGCWIWQLGKNQGYGQLTVAGVAYRAHRYFYEQRYGPIPEGFTLDHVCRNRACVNPDHLEPVPNKVNVLRGTGITAINARKPACIHGHPFDETNTYVTPQGARQCKTCNRERQRAYEMRRKGGDG